MIVVSSCYQKDPIANNDRTTPDVLLSGDKTVGTTDVRVSNVKSSH